VNHRSVRSAACGVCLVVALPACTVGPDYNAPETPVSTEWSGPAEQLSHAQSGSLSTWWDQFDDPVLTELIVRAASANKDLQRAVARIDEARALAGVARGAHYPQVDAFATYDRLRESERTAGAVPSSDAVDNYAFGLDASWEIDVFGRIRRSVEASRAEWDASIEDYRAVSIALFAEVATTYFEVRTLEERLGVAQRNVKIQYDSLDIARARFEAELVSELDVIQARVLLAETESTVPALIEAAARAKNRLSVLLGDQPGSLNPVLAQSSGIPEPPEQLLISTPAEVIRQRPDIRRSERELAAQTARVGVATAELYPRFSISGSFGFESESFGSDLFTGDARAFSVGPRVRLPIFNSRRLRNLVDAEDARSRQALMAYEQAVLTGLEEATSAIEGLVREREREVFLRQSVDAASESAALSDELYRAGLSDYQRVLEAQRALFDSEDALITSEGRQAANVAELYRSFGGGWALADQRLAKEESQK
jgi:multidrug efflux system outer membrane protein